MARILAQLGVRPVGADGTEVAVGLRAAAEPWYLWPRNLRVWLAWCAVQTQWRVGMSGATGLDYPAVWAVLDRRLPRRRRDEAFEAIRGMERAVLTVWADQRDKA